MSDVHSWSGTATEEEIMLTQERMKLYIFPNEAETEEEQAAFEQAVALQIAHERSLQEKRGEIPEGVESFRIGDFHMTFEMGSNSSGLNRKTICEAAYSILLRAGLLCRVLPGTVSE